MEKLIEIVKSDIEAYLIGQHLEILFNERDFQMHLALYLNNTGHYDDVDLEYYVPAALLNGYTELWNSELRLDILVRRDKEYCPVELKYKTKLIETKLSRFGEHFENITVVKNQGAQDLGMYDFWKDVKRVEMVRDRFRAIKSGLCVFLTNDDLYTKPSKPESNNREFCLLNGQNPRSKHWQRLSGTTKGRPSFDLSKDYNIEWKETEYVNNKFHYCIVNV